MIWHSHSAADVLQELRVDPTTGLTNQEVDLRRKEYGKNTLQEQNDVSFLRILTDHFRSPFALILLIVSIVIFLLNLYRQLWSTAATDWQQPLFVAILAVVSVCISAVRHYLARRAVTNAHTLSSPEARVRREGQDQTCAAADLVPGDVVLLKAGDIVPADCRIVEANLLRCDEHGLTKATMPTEKEADAVYDDIMPLAQRTNMLYSGTAITDGTAIAVVVATGVRSEMGRRGVQAESNNRLAQNKAGRISLWWGIAIAVVCVIAFIVSYIHHNDFSAVLLLTASVAMAAFPKNLPDVSDGISVRGMHRLMQHHIQLRRPQAIDTLGRLSVVCIEGKTFYSGEKAQLCRAFVRHRMVNLTEEDTSVPGLGHLLRLAALNTNESACDQAILARLNHMGIEKKDLLLDMPRIGQLPLAEDRTTGIHIAGDQTLILVSGAWHSLLPLCTNNTDELNDAANEMEKDGLRVFCIAYRLDDTAPTVYTPEVLECHLTCAGLLGIRMSLHTNENETPDSLSPLRTILFSDESEGVAKATALQAGITDEPSVLTADATASFSEKDWDDAAQRYNVYCGFTPAQKQQLIAAWQRSGEVVAITASHRDEAELLSAADVVFACGAVATDVVKSVADVLLKDDGYATVMQAVEEGKWIHREKTYAFWFHLACSIVILCIGISGLLGWIPIFRQAVSLMAVHLLLMAIPTIQWMAMGVAKLLRLME